MCTALKYKTCMGRNYDYEQSYKETITNLPKDYNGNMYSIIGVCTGLVKDYPLFYDGMNEYGLCCSALAFSGNAHYNEFMNEKHNLPPYDFVQEILGNHKTVQEARDYLEDTNIIDDAYSERFPNSDLHWFICDKKEAITVESGYNKDHSKTGLYIYENRYNVLTNNPPFMKQIESCIKQNGLIGTYPFRNDDYFSRGTETYGLLGDTTSMSRFQRAYYYTGHMTGAESPFKDDVETFHLLDTVKQVYGATPVGKSYEYTIYSAMYDMDDLKLTIKPYNSLYYKEFYLNTHNEWRMTL